MEHLPPRCVPPSAYLIVHGDGHGSAVQLEFRQRELNSSTTGGRLIGGGEDGDAAVVSPGHDAVAVPHVGVGDRAEQVLQVLHRPAQAADSAQGRGGRGRRNEAAPPSCQGRSLSAKARFVLGRVSVPRPLRRVVGVPRGRRVPTVRVRAPGKIVRSHVLF